MASSVGPSTAAEKAMGERGISSFRQEWQLFRMLRTRQRHDGLSHAQSAIEKRLDLVPLDRCRYASALQARPQQEHLVQADALVTQKVGRVRTSTPRRNPAGG